MKYQTGSGVECTAEENKLIDSLKRLAKRWKKEGKDLMLFSRSGSLCVVKKSVLTQMYFLEALSNTLKESPTTVVILTIEHG